MTENLIPSNCKHYSMSEPERESETDYDVKFDEHDDFKSWWSEYWNKLLSQLGVKSDENEDTD